MWGTEKWIVNSDLYCSKLLYLDKDYRCSLHHHKIKTETFYIIKGLVLLELDGTIRTMHPNDVVDIYPNSYHRFTGLEKSVILEVSTQHFEMDSYRKTKSGKI